MGRFAADDPLGAPFRDAVGAALTAFLDAQAPRLAGVGPQAAALSDLARRFTAGGKRLRPAFCWWGHLAVTEPSDADALLRAAAALDLLHVSALVHDDVMDASATRRGLPAAHKQFETWHADGGLLGAATPSAGRARSCWATCCWCGRWRRSPAAACR